MSFLMLFMPETPIWLLINNRSEEASESLKRFRRNSNVDLELKEIEEQAKQTRQTAFNFRLIKRPNHSLFQSSLCLFNNFLV